MASRSTGYRSHKVHKGIESPERYVLMIWWDTLENHTVDFRQGPLFAEWRAIVGPFFAAPPSVEHFTLVRVSLGTRPIAPRPTAGRIDAVLRP